MAINAFVDLIRTFGGNEYNFTLRETQTHEIIEDVAHLKSEIGVLYLSSRNENVITKLIKKNNLAFEALFTAPLHVFIYKKNPLAKKKKIKLTDLVDFPYLTYEQGDFNSFYFANQPRATSRIIIKAKPSIKVIVPQLECSPSAISGTSSSTTT